MVFEDYLHTEAGIDSAIKAMLHKERPNIDRQAALRFILSAIDLTTLNGDDTEAVVGRLCRRACSFENDERQIKNVAAVCVYPPFVRQAKQALAGSSIKVASVAGSFPSGQSPLFIKVAEVAYAVQEGADEIDMVISRGKFLEGRFEEAGGEIAAIKTACGNARLKVILETGELKTVANIRKASELAIESGADFIKTSTGKTTPAATLTAAWVMMQTIQEYYVKTGKQIGFKPAGGIATPDEAIDYYILLRHVLGTRWLDTGWFRIGASRLADKVFEELN